MSQDSSLQLLHLQSKYFPEESTCNPTSTVSCEEDDHTVSASSNIVSIRNLCRKQPTCSRCRSHGLPDVRTLHHDCPFKRRPPIVLPPISTLSAMVTRGSAAGCSSRFTDQVLGTSAINASSSSSSSSSSGTSRQQQEQQQSMQLNQLLPNPNPVNQWQQSGCDYCYYGYCYPAAIAAAKNTAIDNGKSPADTSNHEKKYRYYSPTYPLCQCWQCVSRMHASACKAASSVPEPCASNSGHLPAATSSSTTTEAAEISSSPAAAFSSHPAYYRCNPYRYHEHVSTYLRSHASVLPDPWRQSANSVRLHPYQYYPTSSADYLRRSTSQKQDYSYGWYTGQAGCQNLDSEKQPPSLPPTTSATKSPIQKFLDQFTNELLQLEQTDGETATPLQVTNPVLNIAARNETPDQSNDISSLIETNDKTDEQKTEQQEQHEDPTSCSRETSEDECEEEDSSSSNHSSSSTATASSDVENEDVDDGDDDATQDAASPVKCLTEEEKEEQEDEWDSEKEAAEQEKSFLTF